MKHLDVRHLWLQDLIEKENLSVKKISCEVNCSYMLTHAPSSADLLKFLPTIGIFPFECSEVATTLVKTALALKPSNGAKLAAAILVAMAAGTEAAEDCGSGEVLRAASAAK